MYYLLLSNLSERTSFIAAMKQQDVNCVFHYVPLHSAPQGLISGRKEGLLTNTSDLSERLVRLPIWMGLGELGVEKVLNSIRQFFALPTNSN
jgi:dTDP-4-amino-4,6-dideoxygalactose transaminase